MGATSSKTTSTTDIANSFVSSAVISVTTKNTTTASGSQNINVSCTDKVATKSAELCQAQQKSNMEDAFKLAALMSDDNKKIELIKAAQAYEPAVCSTCEIGDITQDMGITITVSEINNNEIANKIQAELKSKIDEQLKNVQSGVIGASSSKVESLTKIKNYVENKFDAKIVNESLKAFNFDQNITATNAKAKNVSQKMVANVVASSIVENAMKNDSSLKAAVEKATTIESKTSGVVDSIFGALTAFAGMYMVVAIVVLVVGGFLVYKLKLHCAIPMFAPMCMMNSVTGDDGGDEEEEE